MASNLRKITRNAIHEFLDGLGTADFHALDHSQLDKLSELKRLIGYRAPAKRNGSPLRYFFHALQRRSKWPNMCRGGGR